MAGGVHDRPAQAAQRTGGQPREHVAAQLVRAEQVFRARRLELDAGLRVHKRTREDIESNYGNLIDHEPWKADFYREELRQVLTDLKLI